MGTTSAGDATAELSSVWTTVGGLRLMTRLATRAGSPGRRPVVLVHGLSVSSRYFVPTARHMAPHRAVYAPDLPGFGRSERPPRPLTIPQLAEALAAWMDVWGLARAVMIGNSMGCQIIAELAARSPGRASAIVLVGPTMDRRARTPLQQGLRLLRDGLGESPASVLTQLSDYLRFGAAATLRTLHYALHDPIERKLPLIGVPALVVRGERDPIAPQPWAEEVAGLLRCASLVVIPGAPHALNYDRPAELVRATLDFLAAHPEIDR